MKIYSISGIKVFETEFEHDAGVVQADLSEFANGVYLVVLSADNIEIAKERITILK